MNEVHIRPYEADDVDSLYEATLESVAEVRPWLPWSHANYKREEAQAWIAMQMGHWLARREYQFAVVSSAGRFLGGCGINGINSEHRCGNLGYWVRTSTAGRGAATSAIILARDWTMKNTNLDRLEIVAATDNLASIRVAEKAGATHEGTLRSRLFLHGKTHDAHVYSFIR